jgi:drug/metabolite transporter (DMT)-like permease
VNDTRAQGGSAAGSAPGQFAVVAAAVAALLFWSGTAIANKIAVGHMDALTAGVLRSMLAGFVAIAIATLGRLPLPPGGLNKFMLAVTGTASFAVWPMLLSLGLGYTTANHSALIMALIPVSTGLIAAAFDRRAPRRGWWGGAALALVGTAFLITERSGPLSVAGASVTGDLIVLAGVAVCGLGYVTGGRLTPLIGTRATTFWGLACASIVLVPVFVLLAPRTDWSAVSAAGWAGIAYMTLLSSLLGYGLWFWALGHGGVARIGSFQFGQPVMTLVLAALILGEAVTAPLMIAAAIILVGTWLAQRRAG